MVHKRTSLPLIACLAALALGPSSSALAAGAGSTSPAGQQPQGAGVSGGLTISSTTSTSSSSPRGRHSSSGGGLSSGALLAAVLGGLALLLALCWALMRSRAVEPHWWLALRHSLAESGYRASATWAEVTDWIRLGH